MGMSFTLYKFYNVHLLKRVPKICIYLKFIASENGQNKGIYGLFMSIDFYYLFTLNVKCFGLSRVLCTNQQSCFLFPFNIVLSHVSSTKNK